MENKEQVKEFFGKHAAAYAVSPGHRAGPDLDILIGQLAPNGTESLLDVATATGNTALAVAAHVAHVTGLDITPQMAAEFQRQAQARGVQNADFVLGDVEQMPFADGSFDMATCRRAAHHFPDVPKAVSEIARVLRKGGKFGLVDMTAPEDLDAAELFNQMEAARDSSHAQAISPSAWQHIVSAAGLVVQEIAVVGEDMPWKRWLAPVSEDSAEAALARERALAAPAEVAARVVRTDPDGTLVVMKQRIIMVAVKP